MSIKSKFRSVAAYVTMMGFLTAGIDTVIIAADSAVNAINATMPKDLRQKNEVYYLNHGYTQQEAQDMAALNKRAAERYAQETKARAKSIENHKDCLPVTGGALVVGLIGLALTNPRKKDSSPAV